MEEPVRQRVSVLVVAADIATSDDTRKFSYHVVCTETGDTTQVAYGIYTELPKLADYIPLSMARIVLYMNHALTSSMTFYGDDVEHINERACLYLAALYSSINGIIIPHPYLLAAVAGGVGYAINRINECAGAVYQSQYDVIRLTENAILNGQTKVYLSDGRAIQLQSKVISLLRANAKTKEEEFIKGRLEGFRELSELTGYTVDELRALKKWSHASKSLDLEID